jgi:hypothetical protein
MRPVKHDHGGRQRSFVPYDYHVGGTPLAATAMPLAVAL